MLVVYDDGVDVVSGAVSLDSWLLPSSFAADIEAVVEDGVTKHPAKTSLASIRNLSSVPSSPIVLLNHVAPCNAFQWLYALKAT